MPRGGCTHTWGVLATPPSAILARKWNAGRAASLSVAASGNRRRAGPARYGKNYSTGRQYRSGHQRDAFRVADGASSPSCSSGDVTLAALVLHPDDFLIPKA